MVTEKQWQEIKAEFGEEAFRRVSTPIKQHLFEKNCDFDYWVRFINIELKPLSELFAHDVEVYGGKNALLMWQWQYKENGIGDLWANNWLDCDKSLSFNPNKNYRRKTSAALRFDLERAKAGDVVEERCGDKWVVMDQSFKDAFIENGRVYLRHVDVAIKDLHIKYPPKVRS